MCFLSRYNRGMTDQANADNIPRYARYQGKRVRVVDYQGDGYFRILLSNDTMTNVKRERLTFVRAKKK
ncbi:hypothetical protein SEA_HUWBERT_22 [Microbacterium phage Huwbert]|nr:hypothetical protein SEA_HUWBERT_22 [Microbacterium phage Huwbert]